MFPACDISRYQGAWQNYPCDIVMLKISGGDDGLYFDSDANTNYNDAHAAGKHVGGYHFIGWTMGAAQEASFFVRGMAPKTENDVYALDVESGQVAVPGNAPQYVLDMVNYIHSQTGVYPLIYMNLSTLNAHDWSAVLALCGLWLADWNGNPSGTISTTHTYIMQQYADGPTYDHDEFYGPSLASFDAYGYHAASDPTIQAPTPPAPAPTTTTTTEAPAPPAPDPTTTTSTTSEVVASTSTSTTTDTTTADTTTADTTTADTTTAAPTTTSTTTVFTPQETLVERIGNFIKGILKGLIGR